MNVVLIGMKHCGKTTVGAALARRWDCPFYDVDALIEATYHCRTNEPLGVREIFNRHGEAFFRQIEGQAVCEMYLKLAGREDVNVLALGGRTATNKSVRQLLGDIGLIVYLKVADETLLERVKRRGLPDFLAGEDPEGDFLALCRQRAPEYERQADLIVDLNGLGVEQALAKLIDRIEEHVHAR